jgi:hypothetical protein
MLASLKVSRDIRAQLQSHGLSGVQQRHYDRHDYLAEKRDGLEKWATHLAGLRAAHAERASGQGKEVAAEGNSQVAAAPLLETGPYPTAETAKTSDWRQRDARGTLPQSSNLSATRMLADETEHAPSGA